MLILTQFNFIWKCEMLAASTPNALLFIFVWHVLERLRSIIFGNNYIHVWPNLRHHVNNEQKNHKQTHSHRHTQGHKTKATSRLIHTFWHDNYMEISWNIMLMSTDFRPIFAHNHWQRNIKKKRDVFTI